MIRLLERPAAALAAVLIVAATMVPAVSVPPAQAAASAPVLA